MSLSAPRRTTAAGHGASRSIDTSASGLVNSVLSFQSYSDFPTPPPSTPSTPTRSIFDHRRPATQPRPLPRVPVPPASAHRPPPPDSLRSVQPSNVYDARSDIDVSSISTDFITGLLNDDSASEITYPLNHNGSHPHPPPSRPRHPLSVVSDSDTLYSTNVTNVLQSARRSKTLDYHGAQPVAVAHATLQSLPRPSKDISLSDSTDWRSSTVGTLVLANKATAAKDSDLASHAISASEPSSEDQNPPSLSFLRQPYYPPPSADARHSVHSTKSFAPSFISRISSASRKIARIAPWRKKPLPPVPLIPHIPVATEREHRRVEDSMPLPDLVARAGVLNEMLEKGRHPHHSFSTFQARDDWVEINKVENSRASLGRKPSASYVPPKSWMSHFPKLRNPDDPLVPPNKRKFVIILCFFIILAISAIGAAVGITVNKKNRPHQPVCNGNLTGMACNLDATCVCTSTTNSSCNPLAQNLVDLTASMNNLFDVNYTASDVYASIWASHSLSTADNCAAQARLVDIAPGMSQTSPQVQSFAQSVILWTLVQSLDANSTSNLQATWAEHGSTTMDAAGFTFDPASQSVTQKNVTFVSIGQPTNTQISRVSDAAQNSLDRMYSYALASKTQRHGALANYWTSVLGLPSQQLATFVAFFASSPILIPFDASSQSLVNLYGSSTTFPPPLACYPSLNSSEMQVINSYQTSNFAVNPVNSGETNFSASCYSGQPVYGVLDVLRLRLPYSGQGQGFPQQAVILDRDAYPRAVLRNGASLSLMPTTNSSSNSTLPPNPRQFGTTNNMDHVILDFFNSISDPVIVSALVTFVQSNSNTAPPTSDVLLNSLSSIPTIEVAVFGEITTDDISSVVSSYTTPKGDLFFGSSEGSAMRNWTVKAGHEVTWAEQPISPLVVHDSSLGDLTFNKTWNGAALAISTNTTLTVPTIIGSFQSTGKLQG